MVRNVKLWSDWASFLPNFGWFVLRPLRAVLLEFAVTACYSLLDRVLFWRLHYVQYIIQFVCWRALGRAYTELHTKFQGFFKIYYFFSNTSADLSDTRLRWYLTEYSLYHVGNLSESDRKKVLLIHYPKVYRFWEKMQLYNMDHIST